MPRDLLAQQPRDLLAGQPQVTEPQSKTEGVLRRLGIIDDQYRSFKDEAIGLGEAALQMGTGALATPLAGYAGIVGTMVGGPELGAEVARGIAEGGTYQPRTEAGQRTSEAIGTPFRWLSDKADYLGEVSGDPSDTLGAAGVRAVIEGAPALFGLRRSAAKPLTPRERAFQRGRSEGYVAPPGSVSGRAAPLTIEGFGGKLKLQQQAAQRNQVVSNRLAAEALGLPEGTEITPALLNQVRRSTSPTYDAMRSLGDIQLGARYRAAIENAVMPYRNTQQSMPSLADTGLVKVADELSQLVAVDSSVLVDGIRLLRDKSTSAYASGDKGLGGAYRTVADALENSIDDYLQASGNTQLLTDFRNARQLIAKSYTVENALRGGDVSATVLASQLQRGKPLSGELRTIAEFSQNFPKVTRLMQESVPAYSPLDAAYQLGSGAAYALTANPAAAVPALWSLGRPQVRNYLLSPAGQNMAIARPQLNARGPAAAATINALTETEERR